MTRLAMVGAGMMGEALARGLLASGWSPGDIVLADVRPDLDDIASRLGVRAAGSNAEAASAAEAVLLAVKPQDARTALGTLQGSSVISIVAGLRTRVIEDVLGGGSVVRAMPNTPARVGKGVTALAPGSAASDATRKLAEEVFASVGPVVWLEEEKLDAVTALSGSGPAYVFLVAEAMVDAAVAIGLPRDVAETLAFATIDGAATMLVRTGEPPAQLRAQVTSPGGTTAAALSVMEQKAVRAAFADAIRAAYERSRELGRS